MFLLPGQLASLINLASGLENGANWQKQVIDAKHWGGLELSEPGFSTSVESSIWGRLILALLCVQGPGPGTYRSIRRTRGSNTPCTGRQAITRTPLTYTSIPTGN